MAFGHSKETSDFMADAIVMWWTERRVKHAGVTKLQIELDNGPEINSSGCVAVTCSGHIERTQFRISAVRYRSPFLSSN